MEVIAINVLLTLTITVLGVTLKYVLDEMKKVESQIPFILTEEKLRQILEDKLETQQNQIDSLKEDIGTLNNQLSKLLDMILTRHARNKLSE